MHIYFWILRLASLFGHHKAKLLVRGQQQSLALLTEWVNSLGNAPRILWVHVASVGEFEQVRPIIERLHREQPKLKVLLTFFSPSGYETRKNYPLVDKVLYLPFATLRNAKKWVRTLPLEMAVFVKYEFWPAYLKQLKKHNVPTYLISAIFRSSQLFFKPWGVGYRQLLRCFTHIFVQDLESQQLLTKYRIDSVSIAGDTRFDRFIEVQQAAKELPVVEGFAMNAHQVIVAGSTWLKDEQYLARYLAEREDVKLILVPHEIHSDHLHQIFQLFEGRYIRYTEATPLNIDKCRVLLVDTIGVLSSIYRYGHVAYVGGGFGVSIHNTLEAAVYGIPVIFGPKWQKFREARGLLHAQAAISVSNYKEFARALDTAFATQQMMGERAKNYVQSECGASDIIYKALFQQK
jgi:3-deoxy-D-manno-octulosonic-acid transferase